MCNSIFEAKYIPKELHRLKMRRSTCTRNRLCSFYLTTLSQKESTSTSTFKRDQSRSQISSSLLGLEPCPYTKQPQFFILFTNHFSCAKFTIFSFRHSLTDTIHFIFGLPAELEYFFPRFEISEKLIYLWTSHSFNTA